MPASKIILPKNYTRHNLLQAFISSPSTKFKQACVKGMDENNFSRITAAESKKDNQTKINLNKLTPTQKRKLADFTLKLINQARKQLGLPVWRYSSSAQKLANDIAMQYALHHKSISDQTGHYIKGITTATKANGFTGPLTQDNYVENMGGFLGKQTITMTQAKKKIYFILKQMIFGFAGNNESQRQDQTKYLEWQHAASIFNTQGSKHDGDWDYFGLSISKKGKAYTIHFICIPSFMVKEYHHGTWK
ncbi:SEC10/PgrA surface exclusion domain-containing protein [Lactobacillus sp. PV012]|nr:SEC10/PgrA surface exclusion domain-containing protein [Lactobacillus sp. PV012]